MTNAEWRKLFSRLRTLRWLVRMKRYEASKSNYHANAVYGEESIYIGLMSSHRQRVQFTSAMNDIGEILYGMEGGNTLIKSMILFMITDLWRVSCNYPGQATIPYDEYRKNIPVWETFKTVPRTIDHEKIGPAVQGIDRIIDSSAKDYLPKIMMLKLSL